MPEIKSPNAPDIFVGEVSDMEIEYRGRLHRHNFHELIWVQAGQADLFCDFKTYTLNTGSLVFIMSEQLHTIRGDWRTLDLVVLGFRPPVLTMPDVHAPLLASRLVWVQPFIKIPPERERSFEAIFKALRYHRGLDTTGKRVLLISYLNVICTEILDILDHYPLIRQAQNASERLSYRYQQLVEVHHQDHKNVRDYAAMMHITTNHLVESVRKSLGQTPGQILNQRRLLETKRLLVHTDMPIGRISERLMFSSKPTFIRWFKNLVGTTPTKFRLNFTIP
ncbi:MAG: AraC family transcriptional regulator [Chloroflexota bacterium]